MKQYENFSGSLTLAYDFIENIKASGYTITIPIDIEGIIKYLGIRYEIKPDFNNIKTTGNLTIKGGEPTIWVNPMKNTSEERKRFTLAHELGHFMLHIAPLGNFNVFQDVSDVNISFNRDENWSHIEMEANDFAAQLLMPANFIDEQLKIILSADPNISEDAAVEKLATVFNVSTIAMEYRLKKLGVAL
ncbi:MAG: ImmA/IrrE family metallo-endopeptidase [bacterium]